MAVVFVVAKGRISLLIHKKANLSDLIAATSLEILQKLDSNESHQWIQTWVTVRKRSKLKFDRRPRKRNRAPLLCCFKLCASFQSHWWIQTGYTDWKCRIWVKIGNFCEPCDLEIWRMTLNINRAHLLSNIKLCLSFHHHMRIQTRVMVRKRLSWILTSVTLTFCHC